jgi:hypothetical protein
MTVPLPDDTPYPSAGHLTSFSEFSRWLRLTLKKLAFAPDDERRSTQHQRKAAVHVALVAKAARRRDIGKRETRLAK